MRNSIVALSLLIVGSATAARAAVPVPVGPGTEPMAKGPFEPTWESLESQYKTPDWFRDAKFGIWAHWSAQCVPEHGDWYARGMYEEGSDDYKYQLAHYGPPSQVGFKDLDHQWHAEHWDPEKLMSLYEKAGAQYFCALANHHDNFDCYDSKYQPWNSTRIGPMKDIVGLWAAAARAHHMRFAVSVHASHAFGWFETSRGSDKKGPYAGVPYDGNLTKADGIGTWWEGLDPQDLYAQNHKIGGFSWDWESGKCTIPDQAYVDKFYNRTIDLINKYHPDLLYFDDTHLPLEAVSDAGFKIAAHYYNDSLARTGKVDVVMTGKGLDARQRKGITWDLERGYTEHAEPEPWQTDTCIGSWHYDARIFERHQYKTADQVIHTLVDNVSKNGNLQLSIPVKPDGTIDDDEIKFLTEMAAWMDVNKAAIIGSRPWLVFGEGPGTEAKVGSSNFNEGLAKKLTAADIRFTTHGNTLYAIAMAWPADGKLTIKNLSAGSKNYAGDIGSVTLLGAADPIKFDRTPEGLVLTLPVAKPCEHAFVFKIEPKT